MEDDKDGILTSAGNLEIVYYTHRIVTIFTCSECEMQLHADFGRNNRLLAIRGCSHDQYISLLSDNTGINSEVEMTAIAAGVAVVVVVLLE